MGDFHDKNREAIMISAEELTKKLLWQCEKIGHEQVMQNIYQQIQVSFVVKAEPHTSCGSGCSFCCHDEIFLSQFEADYFKHIAKPLLKPNKEVLRVQNDAEDFKKLPWKDKGCSLLKDGNCAAYVHRPMVCRVHNSVDDPKYCHLDLHPDHGHGQLFAVEIEALYVALLNISGGKYIPLHRILNED